MRGHKLAKIVDGNDLKNGWRDYVNIGEIHNKNHQRNIDTIAEFRHMCDGRFRQINMATHRIVLTEPDVRPIKSAPY